MVSLCHSPGSQRAVRGCIILCQSVCEESSNKSNGSHYRDSLSIITVAWWLGMTDQEWLTQPHVEDCPDVLRPFGPHRLRPDPPGVVRDGVGRVAPAETEVREAPQGGSATQEVTAGLGLPEPGQAQPTPEQPHRPLSSALRTSWISQSDIRITPPPLPLSFRPK